MLITIERGRWGQKTFKDIPAFNKWLESERDFYQPLMQWMPNSNQQFQYFQHSLNSLAQLGASTDPSFQTLVDQATSHAANIYTGWALPPSDSADGKFIKSFDFKPDLQARVAQHLGAPSPSGSEDRQAELIVAAYRYPKLASDGGFTFSVCAADVLRELEAGTAAADALIAEVRSGKDAIFEDLTQARERALEQIADLAKFQRTAIDNAWGEMKLVYDAQLALQAPRTYWERQLASHKAGAIDAKAQFRFLGVTSIVIAIALLLFIWSVTANKPHDIPVALWVLSGGILGIAFWVIRLYSRLYLSREHLARDAEERVTMIETYLALVQHGRIKDDDLKFVLSSIFRPTEDGLVKDDSLPSPLLDLFQQGKGGK